MSVSKTEILRKKYFPKTMKIGKNYFQRDIDSGIFPLLSMELNRRVKNKEATNIVIVGEAGTSKSYTAVEIGLSIDKRFTIDQVVFTYKGYLEEIKNGKMGVPIVFDEPSYAMGKREWYKQINQALVKTVESQRFLVRPLLIPIINLNLLDKTIRSYLIQFQVHVVGRGKARVYRMRASQATDKVYRYLFCTLQYPILNPECLRDTCLGCRELQSCDKFRAEYERKKEEIQLGRYDEGLELAQRMEIKELTFAQIKSISLANDEVKTILNEEDNIDALTLRIILREKEQITIGRSKAYELRKAILRDYKTKNQTTSLS